MTGVTDDPPKNEEVINAEIAKLLQTGDATTPGGSEALQRLAQSLRDLRVARGDDPKLPVVVNVGDGKVAIIDPSRAGPPQVLDFSTLTPEDRQLRIEEKLSEIAQRNAAARRSDIEAESPEAREQRERRAQEQRDRAAADRQRESDAAALRRQQAGDAAAAQRQQAGDAAALQRALAVADKQFDQRIAELKFKLDNGLELSEREKLSLKAAYDERLATLQNQLAIEREKARAELDKPFKEAEGARAQQQVDIQRETLDETRRARSVSEGFQRQDADQRRREAAAKPLLEQSRSMQDQVFAAAQKGTAPTPGLADAVFSPFNMAMQLIGQGVANGQIPQSAVPTPAAPRPLTAAPPADAQVRAPLPQVR